MHPVANVQIQKMNHMINRLKNLNCTSGDFVYKKREFIKKITTIKFPEDDRKIPFRKLGKKDHINKKNQFDLAGQSIYVCTIAI